MPGLRREEVASLAGVSVEYYRRLERGNATGASFTGKTVMPVGTYAVSGLGTAADEYADACEGAKIGRGLAVCGERVRDAGDDIDAWLRRTRLRRAG